MAWGADLRWLIRNGLLEPGLQKTHVPDTSGAGKVNIYHIHLKGLVLVPACILYGCWEAARARPALLKDRFSLTPNSVFLMLPALCPWGWISYSILTRKSRTVGNASPVSIQNYLLHVFMNHNKVHERALYWQSAIFEWAPPHTCECTWALKEIVYVTDIFSGVYPCDWRQKLENSDPLPQRASRGILCTLFLYWVPLPASFVLRGQRDL